MAMLVIYPFISVIQNLILMLFYWIYGDICYFVLFWVVAGVCGGVDAQKIGGQFVRISKDSGSFATLNKNQNRETDTCFHMNFFFYQYKVW